MTLAITEGYTAGCIGRIAQLHAADHAATSGFRLAAAQPGARWGQGGLEQRFVRGEA